MNIWLVLPREQDLQLTHRDHFGPGSLQGSCRTILEGFAEYFKRFFWATLPPPPPQKRREEIWWQNPQQNNIRPLKTESDPPKIRWQKPPKKYKTRVSEIHDRGWRGFFIHTSNSSENSMNNKVSKKSVMIIGLNSLRLFLVMITDWETNFTAVVLPIISLIMGQKPFWKHFSRCRN